jgi:acetyltransferase-like isoleucine patch superfamily enzyme
MKISPIPKNGITRPWLWPIRILSKIWTFPIPPGLWIINVVVQNLLDINNDIPWMVHYTSRVMGKISIGENVWKSFALSGGCYIQGVNGIIIGDNTIFGPGVKIISANHNIINHNQFTKNKPIRIGKKCWLGANCIILPGVELGDNVIIGAGSVVNESYPSNSIVVGNPSRKIFP